MRGKVPVWLPQTAFIRITPAYAGKSSFQNRSFSSREDHPRLCGEKQRLNSGFSAFEGSPPPMRGKERFSAVRIRLSGITPAYAGKSVSKCNVFRITQDHPRLCGEKGTLGIFMPGNLGSPPPMRGKVKF